MFIYDALVELVTSGDTSVPSDLAIATINSYKEPDGDCYKGKAMSTISKQFLVSIPLPHRVTRVLSPSLATAGVLSTAERGVQFFRVDRREQRQEQIPRQSPL